MTSSGPAISSRRTWLRWEAFFINCTLRALDKLLEMDHLPESENALNSKLLACLRIAAKEICPAGNYPLIRAECPPLHSNWIIFGWTSGASARAEQRQACRAVSRLGEYLISVVSPWEGVDYVRSILLTALEPRFNLHLPAEDPEMSISTRG